MVTTTSAKVNARERCSSGRRVACGWLGFAAGTAASTGVRLSCALAVELTFIPRFSFYRTQQTFLWTHSHFPV